MKLERLIVADAGPIIALASIARLELLRALAIEVLVPRSVFEEVLAGAPRPGALELSNADWIRVVEGAKDLVEAFRIVVDLGEAEALAVAKSDPRALLVIDDLRARRLARSFGLRLTGTLGILDMAKRAGLIEALRPEVDGLLAAGIHIDVALRNEFLRRNGE